MSLVATLIYKHLGRYAFLIAVSVVISIFFFHLSVAIYISSLSHCMIFALLFNHRL